MPQPFLVPPPPDAPFGWTPNALGPSPGSQVSLTNLAAQAAANQAGGIVGGSGVVIRPITIPVASARILNATPFTIVPAMAGAIILPLFWWLWDVRGAVAMTATPVWTIRHIGTTTTLLNSINLLAGATVAPNTRFSIAGTTGTPTQNDVQNPVGVGLELVANVGFTGGDGNVWTVGVAIGLIRP
jgi:hypothetical protein